MSAPARIAPRLEQRRTWLLEQHQRTVMTLTLYRMAAAADRSRAAAVGCLETQQILADINTRLDELEGGR